jgi:hypothetical protein
MRSLSVPLNDLQAKAAIRNSLLANAVGEDSRHFLNAIALLEQSTRIDSTFALAYCQIAKADDWLYLEHLDGPDLVDNLATVYALTNEPDLALRALAVSVTTPGGITYGNLKLDPAWDPLRSDPRFDKLLAQIAPR